MFIKQLRCMYITHMRHRHRTCEYYRYRGDEWLNKWSIHVFRKKERGGKLQDDWWYMRKVVGLTDRVKETYACRTLCSVNVIRKCHKLYIKYYQCMNCWENHPKALRFVQPRRFVYQHRTVVIFCSTRQTCVVAEPG